MENLESRLRDAFSEAPTYSRRSVSELIASTRRVRHRRTAMQAVATSVAAAAIVLLVASVAFRPTSGAQQPPENALAQANEDKANAFGIPVGGRFIDAKHGFIVLERCTPAHTDGPSPSQGSCRDLLEATSDGGTTFHERAMPTPLNNGFNHVYIFDFTHLVLAQSTAIPSSEAPFPTGKVPGEVDRARWVSSDGGASWTPVSLDPGMPVAAIPAGSQILLDGYGFRPTAVMGRDGIAHPLTPAAAIMTTDGDSVLPYTPLGEVDGSYFAYNYSVLLSNTNPPPDNGLMVSQDKGRTWNTVHIPLGATNPTVVGSDGHWFYAEAMGPSIESNDVSLASSDGGRTWQTMGPIPTSTGYGLGVAVSPADGGLLLNDGSGIWRAVGVGTFARISDSVTTEHLFGLGAKLAALRVDAAGRITLATSTDGKRWKSGTIR